MKQIHFDIPQELWDAFFRVFPGKGERTNYLRTVIEETVNLNLAQRNTIRKMIRNLLNEEDEV